MERLVAQRGSGLVSIYVPTDPDGHRSDAERIELDNHASSALEQLKELGVGGSALSSVEESLADLIDDDEYWRFQARTLAIFTDGDRLVSYRLPNRLPAALVVSDRFFIKPLLRTFTFPQAAFVLAISLGDVRLIEASHDLPPDRIQVPDLPSDVASAVGKSSIRDRSHDRRVGGSEGQKLRMRQYARQINRALALVVGGHDLPMVLAGTEPMLSIYRSVNSYPHLLDEVIGGNPDQKSDAELVAEVRPILDRMYDDELAQLKELFGARQAQGRAVTDLADVARAATIGAVDTLLVDIEQSVSGDIDEQTGLLTTGAEGSASIHGVTDEIARRVLMSSGRVLAVRGDDVPGNGAVAALLRFPLS
jgi:Bacterial archaeo-eukaryotic release factor family 11